MAWRPAASLPVLHTQLKHGAPRAAPPATSDAEWGLIGDAVHDPSSDHSPHDFPGWGNDIVTAADFPNRPDLGLDAHKVLDDIRAARDPRAKYGISNGQIFSNHPVAENGHSYPAWAWRPYTGSSDGHYTHGHLSVVGDARADGTQPWPTIGGTVMDDWRGKNNETYLWSIASMFDAINGLVNEAGGAVGPVNNALGKTLKAIQAQNVAILTALGVAQADIDELQARPAYDPVALAEVLSEHLNVTVSAEAVTAALESPRGQVALVGAANKAEDS